MSSNLPEGGVANDDRFFAPRYRKRYVAIEEVIATIGPRNTVDENKWWLRSALSAPDKFSVVESR